MLKIQAEQRKKNNNIFGTVDEDEDGPVFKSQIVTSGPMTGLKKALNGNRQRIFVETEHENGKPRVWYKLGSKGNKHRWESNGYSTSGQIITDPNHRAKYMPNLVENGRIIGVG